MADLQSAALPQKLREKRENPPPLSPQLSLDGPKGVLSGLPELAADADLARLLTAWPALSQPIRRAIRALLDSGRDC